jgi:hypothetical protein
VWWWSSHYALVPSSHNRVQRAFLEGCSQGLPWDRIHWEFIAVWRRRNNGKRMWKDMTKKGRYSRVIAAALVVVFTCRCAGGAGVDRGGELRSEQGQIAFTRITDTSWTQTARSSGA